MQIDRPCLWTALGEPHVVRTKTTKQYLVRCRCVCGVEKDVYLYHLRGGKTKSCGKCGNSGKGFIRSKQTRIPTDKRTRQTWHSMLNRCYNPKAGHYSDYGGRGIFVCARWQEPDGQGFINFLSDMGPRPGKEYSINRIDNDGPYSPENCEWATKEAQANNTRVTVKWESCGIWLNLKQWSSITGTNYSTLRKRLDRGWDFGRAMPESLVMDTVKRILSER